MMLVTPNQNQEFYVTTKYINIFIKFPDKTYVTQYQQ
jgi:hypothetical protein